MAKEFEYEAVVIGSGFGGAINTCRLSKKWPSKVLLLERGKRYPMGSFPRKPHDFSHNFWHVDCEQHKPLSSLDNTNENSDKDSHKDSHGLFDIRNYKRIDAVVSAGLGGGSLIYANVFLPAPKQVFEQDWPKSITKESLEPYYDITKQVLGARPIPQNNEPRRKIIRTELFQSFAKKENKPSQLLDINVFFGNDFKKPMAMGEQAKNRYGALQTSCTYCAECNVGCNTHSKNTLDLNYLFVAEQHYQAQIKTQVLANKIIPLNKHGAEDTHASGQFGYRVYYFDLKNNKAIHHVDTKRVVLAAGTLGTNELLMRCRDRDKTLPRISSQLGKHFSGNGDFVSFAMEGKQEADPSHGPVITQAIDYNLFENFDRKKAYLLQDAAFPAFLAWYIEGIKPRVSHIFKLIRLLKLAFWRVFLGKTTGRVGYAFSELSRSHLTFNSSVLLTMGLDNSNGKMYLKKNGFLEIKWPYRENLKLYKAVLATGQRFKTAVKAKALIPLLTWFWPMRNNITVHPLGGCRLADNIENGVCSAEPKTMGQVFNYQNLYIADGSLVPTALGANPAATISALAECVAEGITGIKPDAKL
jgi:cholesterol oxidase